ncbi:MAG: TlpA family protein disulfide reductase, partial [Thermoguttaceae bacterium]|nr:TlpA family protein disulfide reductase [Thermoguttaceae bacterium]
KANVATMTCYKYLSELPDIDAADRTGYFRQYVAGLGYVGDLDGLNALLAAEEAKDPVDQSRVDLLKFQVASVSVDKAVEANDEAAIKKLGTELIEKAKTDDYWASRTPSILEDLARSKPAIGVPMLKDLCAAFAASDDESRKRIATRFEGKIRFADLVGNEMKVEGLYLDGTEIDWKSYRGKVVLVDFWATWCGPCIGEIPNMTKMYEKYNAAGFEILGYSIDDDLERLHKFEEERKLPWKTASRKLTQDAEKDYVIISEYYGVNAIPTMVLVGKDGKVLSTKARGAELERLLGEQFPEVK